MSPCASWVVLDNWFLLQNILTLEWMCLVWLIHFVCLIFPSQYCDDVWLMFENAWLYNRKTSRVYKYCTKVSPVYILVIQSTFLIQQGTLFFRWVMIELSCGMGLVAGPRLGSLLRSYKIKPCQDLVWSCMIWWDLARSCKISHDLARSLLRSWWDPAGSCKILQDYSQTLPRSCGDPLRIFLGNIFNQGAYAQCSKALKPW